MGKIVGHCTVGWQVNEAQMAGLTHGGAHGGMHGGDARRRGAATRQGIAAHGIAATTTTMTTTRRSRISASLWQGRECVCSIEWGDFFCGIIH